MTVTCKSNKNTMVVFRRPFDDKVSLFLKDLELRAAVISIKNLVPYLYDLLLFYGGRKKIHLSWIVDDFFP